MNIYDKMAVRNISDYCKQLSFIVSFGFIILIYLKYRRIIICN